MAMIYFWTKVEETCPCPSTLSVLDFERVCEGVMSAGDVLLK